LFQQDFQQISELIHERIGIVQEGKLKGYEAELVADFRRFKRGGVVRSRRITT
jgi:hypothetical protein